MTYPEAVECALWAEAEGLTRDRHLHIAKMLHVPVSLFPRDAHWAIAWNGHKITSWENYLFNIDETYLGPWLDSYTFHQYHAPVPPEMEKAVSELYQKRASCPYCGQPILNDTEPSRHRW